MSGHSGKKILVVDDEKEIRDLIKETLSIDDFQILEADSGERAWKTVRKHKPDLILMDVVLPGALSGFDVCRRVRKHSRTQKIPVVFLSAYPLQEEKKCQDCGSEFFRKPFSPLQLINKIYMVLDQK